MIRKTPYNSTYPKGGVSCSKDSFVANQTLVFQIKCTYIKCFCINLQDENRGRNKTKRI